MEKERGSHEYRKVGSKGGNTTHWEVIKGVLASLVSDFVLGFKYVTADFKRNKRNVAVGVITIAISVAFCALVFNHVFVS